MYLIKIYSAGFSTAYMTSRRSLFSVQAALVFGSPLSAPFPDTAIYYASGSRLW